MCLNSNIPLDARIPIYTYACDAAQNNIFYMWDFSFWKDYIDTMAYYHYNYISLRSLHPISSLVKVLGYEDVALDGGQRYTTKWQENHTLMGIGFDTPEILENPKIIKTISIGEKIEFRKKVMSYGKIRIIDFHIITWNIFDYEAQGKYEITDDSGKGTGFHDVNRFILLGVYTKSGN